MFGRFLYHLKYSFRFYKKLTANENNGQVKTRQIGMNEELFCVIIHRLTIKN